MEYIVIAILALLGVKEYFSFVERREVYDRLMSKTLPEFKDNDKPEANDFDETEVDIVPIDQAMEDILNGKEEE